MNSTDIQDPFLTVAEVAGLLKLNQQTVRNWIDQGSLPAVRVGRRVRIRRTDLERVLTDGYSGGGGGSGASRQAAPGPSAEDFWGGEAVGTAEPPPPAHDPLGVVSPTYDRAAHPPHEHEHEPGLEPAARLPHERAANPSDAGRPAAPAQQRDDEGR